MSSVPEGFDIPLTTGAVLSESPFDSIPAYAAIDTGELDGDPAIAFRRTLGMFATGVTVLTTVTGDSVHAMTANAFMSVSLSPPLVLVSIDRRARLCGMLHEGSPLGVSVLAEGQHRESDYFAHRAVEGFEPSFAIVDGTPLVEGALAQFAGRIVRSYWGGDHSLFLSQVGYARVGQGTPLLFHGGRYTRLVNEEHVLGALPNELREPLFESGVERRFADGTQIMRRGEPGDSLIVVLEGEVQVARPGRQLILGPGEIVGELEVLSPGASGRFADIIAIGEVRALLVERDALRAALLARPEASLALLEILVERFREV